MDPQILEALKLSAVEIHGLIRDGRGLHVLDDTNASGDRQIGLDVLADTCLVDRLSAVPGVGRIASEEHAAMLDANGGNVTVAIDPIDGSKAAMVGIPPGTIFAVVEQADRQAPIRGRDIVAAGFFVYGAALELYFADAGQVSAQRYDRAAREWRRMLLPDGVSAGQTLGLNPSNYPVWPVWMQRYYDGKINPAGDKGRPTLRWYGSLVSDVKRLLLEGGVLANPERTEPGFEQGQLRLLYEALPMAYLVEALGGRSSDGERSLLDRQITSLHEKVPVFLGDRLHVEEVEALRSGAIAG